MGSEGQPGFKSTAEFPTRRDSLCKGPELGTHKGTRVHREVVPQAQKSPWGLGLL